MATGATLSSIVTVAEQVLELPFTSVTVKITVLLLMLAQVNVVVFNAKPAMPQASVEALLTCEAVIVAEPFTSN